METSFLSGSENLYKYLVSIGLLLIVLTVFYPLKEKQDLEVSRITAANYLNTLAKDGILVKERLGNGNYYINQPLFDLLSNR